MSDRAEQDETKPVYRAAKPPPSRPDRSLIAIMLLAIVALAGTLALLPNSEEKAAALLEEGRYVDAIDMLVAVEDERFLNAYEGYMLFKLYVLTRQTGKAAMLLQQEPALQAENAWALRQLTTLYRQDRDFAGEASTLRQLYDIKASDADFARLRVLYRLTGDVAGEASLLASAIDGGDARPVNVERLAYLRSAPAAVDVSAVWIAPFGSFSAFADGVASYQALAFSDLSPTPTTSLE